jgi:hypothetical protein
MLEFVYQSWRSEPNLEGNKIRSSWGQIERHTDVSFAETEHWSIEMKDTKTITGEMLRS